MDPQLTAFAMDSGEDTPVEKGTQRQTSAEVDPRRGNNPRNNRWFSWLGWLVLPFLLAVSLEACGRISLMGTDVMVLEDTTAKIRANYSPWPLMSFLPVDPTVLVEISRDTGQAIVLNEQDPSKPPVWGDPGATLVSTPTGEPTATLSPSGTPTGAGASPTATLEDSASLTATATAATTATPPLDATPTTSGNQNYNYTSTPEPPQPKPTGDHGSGVDEQDRSNQK